MADKIKVYDPRGYPPVVTGKTLAPRLESLDGKVVYLVDCLFDNSEIFMVLKGGYRFFWGNHAEHHVDLGPLDMFAVPIKVMRKFHSNREQPGTIMVI